jgi:hypothetical protein
MVEQHILDSFQTMWGPFPEPVMLIHKTRTILAVNDLARTMGIPVGTKCFSLNPEAGPDADHCASCQANLALKSGQTISTEERAGEHTIIGYWMPLKEFPDVYVHFGVGTNKAMAAVNNTLDSHRPNEIDVATDAL